MNDATISCSRRIQFCAGHRVMGHESKCANMHGHNYVAHFLAVRNFDENNVDSIGRVIDFSVLKEKLGQWIDQHWDHGFIYHQEDVAVAAALVSFVNIESKGQKMFAMPYNPTAENMARYLLEEVCPRLLKDCGVRVASVVIEETENCKAEATR